MVRIRVVQIDKLCGKSTNSCCLRGESEHWCSSTPTLAATGQLEVPRLVYGPSCIHKHTYASLESLLLKKVARPAYEDTRMKHENSARLNLKRSTSEESEAVKKVKLEELEVLKTEDLEDELPQIRNKPLNRGVERISPYPTECRPTQPYYDWHRRQLIKDVTERLAIQGRRIVGLPRFLCVSVLP